MNTHISVSTIPHLTGWHAINWKACHARVRKLQLRIAKATRQQQWRQVRELQRVLTRSFSGTGFKNQPPEWFLLPEKPVK